MTPFWAWQLLAASVGEWVAIVTLFTGSGLAGTFVSGWVASRRLRVEKQTQARTVAAEEAETAVRVIGEAMHVLRGRLDLCEEWRREHRMICPLTGPRRDRHG